MNKYMIWFGFALLCGVLLLAACTPTDEDPGFEQIDSQPIVDTPTPSETPTQVPTFVPITEEPTATQTPSPSPTARPAQTETTVETVSCEVILETLFESATEHCLAGPVGFFCNGGLLPRVEPAAIANSLSAPGTLVEANLIDQIRTPPLPSNFSGGLMWLRLEEFVQISVVMLGDVEMTDNTTDEDEFPPWQIMTVQTKDDPESTCDRAPYSSLVIQSPIAIPTRFVLNGTSVDLDGTVVIQTTETETKFILLEGLGRITIFGQAFSLFPGQQLDVVYNAGDFSRPVALPELAQPLDFDRVANLPVALFDRPVLLPQPGYVTTEGAVNLRAEPTINSGLLYQVPAGQIISVLGKNPEGDWFHVRLGNDATGWMKADLLSQRIGQISLVYDETPVPPGRFSDAAELAVVNVVDGVNLREAPDTSFRIIGTLPFGTEVNLIARSSYSPWVKVNHEGREGWVALVNLETQSAISFLPIDYVAPLPAAGPAPTIDFTGGHAYPDPNR